MILTYCILYIITLSDLFITMIFTYYFLFFQVASATATSYGLSRGLLGLKWPNKYFWFWFWFWLYTPWRPVYKTFAGLEYHCLGCKNIFEGKNTTQGQRDELPLSSHGTWALSHRRSCSEWNQICGGRSNNRKELHFLLARKELEWTENAQCWLKVALKWLNNSFVTQLMELSDLRTSDDDAYGQTCLLSASNHDQCTKPPTLIGCNKWRQGNVLCSAKYYPYIHPVFLFGHNSAYYGKVRMYHMTGVIGRHGVCRT